MFCTACGRQLAEGTGFCPACGTAASPSVVPPPGPASSHLRPPQSLTAVTDFLQEVASVSLKEIALVDGDRAAEILRSPVFLLLSLVAIVPLAIQSLESAHSILYGLAIWSGLLWALLNDCMARGTMRSEEYTSELQSHSDLVCRLLLEKKKNHKEKRERISSREDCSTSRSQW